MLGELSTDADPEVRTSEESASFYLRKNNVPSTVYHNQIDVHASDRAPICEENSHKPPPPAET
eukprot:240157-Pyramimonas_sp.AAC.1